MSRVTREINKISIMVISVSGRLIIYALILVCLVFGARRAYEFGHRIFYSPAIDPEPGTVKVVTLKENESVFQVGERLEDAGLIRDGLSFAIQAMIYEYKVQGGTYELNTAQSSRDIINELKEAAE